MKQAFFSAAVNPSSLDKSVFCGGVGGSGCCGLGGHVASLILFHLNGGFLDRFAGLKLGLVVRKTWVVLRGWKHPYPYWVAAMQPGSSGTSTRKALSCLLQ